ncbi:hypothetical protein LguiB_007349 [Lonicera macranthoides]
MVFWCRIKQSQLKTLSNQFKRCYFQIHGPCSLNHTASSHIRNLVLDNSSTVSHRSQFEFGNNVRFFAAPVQVTPKQDVKDTSGPRLNEQITSQYVRLVTDEGHSIVSRHEALERARTLKVDLVEVQRTAKPPVCKLMDYHREKYEQRLKEKDRLKSKNELSLRKGACKEVRFAFKIERKDLQMKADMVTRLMERGYRVKCMAIGTEEQDLGGLLSRFAVLIEDVSIVESGPRVEKKQAYVIVRHSKFGPSKKGTKKLSKIVMPTGPMVQNSMGSPQTLDAVESGSENEDDMFSEEDANDDFEEDFDTSNDVNVAPKRSLPVVDFTKTPSPSVAPPVIENRYRRDPRNGPLHTKQMNVNVPNARDSIRSGPSFQMFGPTEANNTPGKQSGPAVVNRYKKGPNANPPGSNFQGSRRPDVDKVGQVRWGGFHSENSNVIPNRNAESQAKVQR